MPAWLRNPVGLLLFVTLLLGITSVASLASEIGQPFGGYASTLFFIPLTAPGGIVSQETPTWWPIRGVSPSVDESAYLLAIDGKPYQTVDVGAVFQAAQDRGAESVTILVEWTRQEIVGTIEVPIFRFDFINFLELKLPEMITGLCLWLTALAVLKARPEEPVNRAFAAIASVVALNRWTLINSIWIDLQGASLLPEIPLAISAGFIGIGLLRFALLFPKRLEPWPRRTLRVLYGIVVIIMLLHTLSRVPAVYDLSESPKTALLIWSDRAFLGVLLLYLIGIIVLFGRLIWLWLPGRQTRRDRRMAIIVAAGLLAALPMLLVSADVLIPGLGVIAMPFWRGFDLRYLFVAVPFAFAFVIIRYHNMRSPSRLLILVVALAGSALLAALLSWLWGLSQDNWPANGEHPPFPYLFAGIFLTGIFWSTQANWRGWFGRLLDWEPASYAATHAFGRRVAGLSEIGGLSQSMAGALVDELQLERAAVWLVATDSERFELRAEAGEQNPPLPLTLVLPGAELVASNSTYRLYTDDEIPHWLEPLRITRALDVAVPLYADERPIGLLGLGHRWDEEIFDDRDLLIAGLIGQQATLFLQAALQIEELRRVPQRIVAAQESERRRLAAELHDTVSQFLGGLPFALAFTANELRHDPLAAAEALARCLNEAEAMAETVRGIRFNLAPAYLEHSLTQPLGELVARIARRSGLRVVLRVGDGLDEATTAVTRPALYRVIQQGLDNAVAHAEASAVDVRLACDDGRVTFSVSDDGRGSTEAERRAAERDGHVGLSTMRERLLLCGGEFTFVSAPGEGTIVSGWVPADNAPQK